MPPAASERGLAISPRAGHLLVPRRLRRRARALPGVSIFSASFVQAGRSPSTELGAESGGGGRWAEGARILTSQRRLTQEIRVRISEKLENGLAQNLAYPQTPTGGACVLYCQQSLRFA